MSRQFAYHIEQRNMTSQTVAPSLWSALSFAATGAANAAAAAVAFAAPVAAVGVARAADATMAAMATVSCAVNNAITEQSPVPPPWVLDGEKWKCVDVHVYGKLGVMFVMEPLPEPEPEEADGYVLVGEELQ